MSPDEIENAVNKILHGKFIVEIDKCTYFFRSPTIEEKNFASYIYNRSLKNYKEDGMKSTNELLEMARKSGFWTAIDDNYKDKFDEITKFAKEECGSSLAAKRKLEGQLKKAEKKRFHVLNKYNDLIINSVEQQAYEDKIKYLISRITQDENGIPVWKKIKDFNNYEDDIFLKKLVDKYIDNIINFFDVKMIRQIARSSQWRFRWIACKNNLISLFGTSINNCDDIQLALIYWSLIYDSVYNSLNVPSDDIINDDEKLDQWLDDRNKEDNAKRMTSQSQKGFYDKNGKFRPHGKSTNDYPEIGVMIEGYWDKDGYFHYYTTEEKKRKIEEIQSRNTTHVRKILANENKTIEDSKYIEEGKLRGKMKRRMLLGDN